MSLRPLLLALAALSLAACQPRVPAGMEADSAAYVTMLGDDTLAVEQFRRTPSGMEADVVLRTPRTTVGRYRLDLDDAGRLSRYEAVIHRPGAAADAPPVRREVFVPAGDSLRVTVTEDGATETRTVSGDAQGLPFIDMVHWPFELMLTRADAAAQDRRTQGLFTDRGTQPFEIAHQGDGRMSVTHPFRGTMEVRVDEEGRLLSLDAGATTRKLTVRRVPSVNIPALARRFADRDLAGQSFGPLSGRGEASATVDGAMISVDYGVPVKRGREIFGALVPWGEVWRTGANQATHFETSRDLVLGGLAVPAGRYTLFTIPQPGGGTLMVNRQTGQGGTTYNQDQDLGRVNMTMSPLSQSVEAFTIRVDDTAAGGMLRLQWDQTEFSVPFTVQD